MQPQPQQLHNDSDDAQQRRSHPPSASTSIKESSTTPPAPLITPSTLFKSSCLSTPLTSPQLPRPRPPPSSSSQLMDFHFSPQPRGFSHSFCSPSPLSCSPPFPPSSSPFHTPSLSLPPPAYYFDTASYAGDSVVSSVDGDGYHLPSLPSDEQSSHPSLEMDDFSAMEQLSAAQAKEGAVDGARSLLLGFTPQLQPLQAPPMESDEAPYTSESSASTSPVFPSPLPSLTGYASASSASVLTEPHTQAQSTPSTPREDPLQPHPTAAETYPPQSSSIFDDPHPSPPDLPSLSLPAPHPAATCDGFSLGRFASPATPLAPPPTDSICSAPALPPITGSPFPFSPPIPLSQCPSSSLVASSYVESACERLLKHRQSMEMKPSLIRQMGEEEKRAIVKTSMARPKLPMKLRKGLLVRKDKGREKEREKASRKRKRLDSDDGSSSDSSDSSDSSSDSDDEAASASPSSGGVKRPGAALSQLSKMSKKERNKMSASAYRKRKKAHIDSLYSVADTLKVTVQEQSDLIDCIQRENRALKEQLSFIQQLLAFTPHAFPQLQALLHAKREKPQQPEWKGAAPPLALPASPKPTPLQPPSPAIPPLATINGQGAVTLLSPDAASLLPSLLPCLQPADSVVVKREPGTAEKEVDTVACLAAEDVGLTAGASSAQRASLFLFVIFSCFLLFNPNALPPTTTSSDVAFPELSAELLHYQYQQGGAFRSSLAVDDGGRQGKVSQQAPASAAASEEAGTGLVRSFLAGSDAHVDEAFFAHVLDAVYLPLVRLVGEQSAQEAITRLASGVALARAGKQQAQVSATTEEPGAPSAAPVADVTTAAQ